MKVVSYRGVPFLLPPPGKKSNSQDVSMAYWWKDSLRSALTYIEQVWYVHQFVDLDKLSVFEVFAGLGTSTAPLRSRTITKHVGLDHDTECLDAFTAVHEGAEHHACDSYETAPKMLKEFKYDYVLAEYNALTLYRAIQSKKERPLLDAIFTSGARYIVIVDSAKVKEHLHYSRYGSFFDSPVYDSASYIESAGNFMRRLYGYGVIATAHDAVNYTMLFEKGAVPDYSRVQDTRATVNLKLYKEMTGDVDV